MRIALRAAALLAVGGLVSSAYAQSMDQQVTPASPEAVQQALAGMPDASSLPQGTRAISGVVKAMGAHHAAPADVPPGPLYCVFEGKVICLEFVLPAEEVQNGQAFMNLRGIEGLPPVDHMNISLSSDGHKGVEFPHYDIHLYFVSPEVLATIQP